MFTESFGRGSHSRVTGPFLGRKAQLVHGACRCLRLLEVIAGSERKAKAGYGSIPRPAARSFCMLRGCPYVHLMFALRLVKPSLVGPAGSMERGEGCLLMFI